MRQWSVPFKSALDLSVFLPDLAVPVFLSPVKKVHIQSLGRGEILQAQSGVHTRWSENIYFLKLIISSALEIFERYYFEKSLL